MGKAADNKKRKKEALLSAAYRLFTEKGFSKTTISDIVDDAGLAKGTFYLYFNDKYDLRNQLIAFKAGELFDSAYLALKKSDMDRFEDELIFFVDFIIGRFRREHSLMEFVARNLSWGVFKDMFSNTEFLTSQQFYDYYLQSLDHYGVKCRVPELMLFTIIELVGATSYNCILREQPVSIDEYLPYLHKTLRQIIPVYTDEGPDDETMRHSG